jgi:hypothetical protein
VLNQNQYKTRNQTIVELCERGYTYAELGKMFNVSGARIRSLYLKAIAPGRKPNYELQISMNLRTIALKIRIINYLYEYVTKTDRH